MFSKFLFIIFYISFIIIRQTNSNRPLLFVLLYDGFRNDYLDRGITPTLSNFRANGVHSDYMKTVYPALGISAMHSISTGYYPQVHGYNMRDEKLRGNDYNYKKYIKEKKEEFKIIPIWELNQKNGGKTICSMWEGMYNYTANCTCTHTIQYNREISLKTRADNVIKLLNVSNSERPNLVLFYVEELDRITHFFGALSRNSTLMIRRLDLLTKYIIKKLIDLKIYHNTNIMILSDHGMFTITNETVVDMYRYNFPFLNKFREDDVNTQYSEPLTSKNMIEEKYILKLLWDEAHKENKFTIVRIPPNVNRSQYIIEMAACPGYFLNMGRWAYNSFDIYEKHYMRLKLKGPLVDYNKLFYRGVHGYLRENDAVFMAKGPMFARFKKVEPFHMVDLYSAFTKLLNIKGQYENEGNFTRVLPIFTSHNRITWISILVSIFALALISTACLYFIIEYILYDIVEL